VLSSICVIICITIGLILEYDAVRVITLQTNYNMHLFRQIFRDISSPKNVILLTL